MFSPIPTMQINIGIALRYPFIKVDVRQFTNGNRRKEFAAIITFDLSFTSFAEPIACCSEKLFGKDLLSDKLGLPSIAYFDSFSL